MVNPHTLKIVEDALIAHHRSKEAEAEVQALFFIEQGYRMSELVQFIRENGMVAHLCDAGTATIIDSNEYNVAIRVPKPRHTLLARRMWRWVFGLKDSPIYTIKRRVMQ